jgi:hypothetical protein
MLRLAAQGHITSVIFGVRLHDLSDPGARRGLARYDIARSRCHESESSGECEDANHCEINELTLVEKECGRRLSSEWTL